VLNFPFVQTVLTHTVANYYSRKFHVKVHIGKVDFEFFKKLVLRDVFIQDLHADTLFYANDLKLDIGQVSFKNHEVFLSNTSVDKAKLHLITYKNEHSLNLQFLIDAFASRDTTKSTGSPWKFALGKLTLNNLDFSLQNQHDTVTDDYGINTSNLHVHEIYGTINTIQFMGDTVRATIDKLSAKEQSGFVLNKLSCYVSLCPRGMELDALKIQTLNSDISTDLVFKYNGFSDFGDFTNKVDMKAIFHKSKVCFDDIGYFAHALKAVHNCFTLSGEYKGTVNHLKAHNMNIGWGKFSNLEGEAQLDNITNLDSAFIKVTITNLTTSKSEIEGLPAPPFDKENHIRLPDNISKLNTIHFNGFFEGAIRSFKAGGSVSTDIGDISANLHLWELPGSHEAYYTGMLQTKNFNLGYYWQVEGLGNVTSSVSISGIGLKKENADASLSGTIQNITYRKYTYQNTAVKGELKKGFFSGYVKVIDPHLLMDFNGKINLSSENSVFQFESHIAKANLTALHIIKDSAAYGMLSGHIKVNATGDNMDDMQGSLYIDSTSFAIRKEAYHIDHLMLTSSARGDYHKINLTSDYANGELSGHFRLSDAPECLQNLMSAYLPSVFSKEKQSRDERNPQDYALALQFNENTSLTNLFIPGLKIATGTTLKGSYNEASDNFVLDGKSNEIDIASKKLKNWNIHATSNKSSLVFTSRCDTLYVSDSLYTAAFTLNGNIAKDTIHYAIKWSNDSANYASIPGYVGFPDKSKIVFKFLHPVISIVDSAWKINDENLIVYDSSRWEVKSFIISNSKHSSISLQGIAGSKYVDKLDIALHDINLASLNLGSSQLEGEINGTASISNLFGRPFFTSALSFSGLVFNKEYLGSGTINSSWDTTSQSISLDGHYLYHGTPVLSITGKYTPGLSTNNLNIDAYLVNFPSALFQPYLKDVCSVLDGSLMGQVHISGTPAKPLIYGNVTAALTKMKFDYLNISCHSPGINIKILPDTFQILPSVLLDEKGDTAKYTGTFTHHNFKDLHMDFYLDANKFLCLNTNEMQNSSYFGKAYVTGNLRIYGLLDALHIDANITTDKNTVFNIPLEGTSEIDQVDYIQFTSKGKSKQKTPGYKVNLSGLQLYFIVHVTPDATANILFSNKGEVLSGKGSGTIQFSMDNIGDIYMDGKYVVTGGSYNFVLQNIINKKFILQPGGTIAWNGDPYNADINLTTQYETRASLEAFFPYDITGVYNKRVPVDCDLDLSGKLTSPDISFKIDLPNSDNDTKQVVESYLSDPGELTTQVFTLLIINNFMSVSAGSGLGSAIGGGQIGSANSAAILSSQLTNLFNNLNKSFNIAVDYNPSTGITPAEYKVALSTALFNGRLNVTTDVGTTSGIPSNTQTTNTNTNLIGELDAEYRLNKSGKLQLKVFNKANDNTTLNALNAPYTQGAGLSYKESFNSWTEIWHKIFGGKPKASQTTSSSK